MSCTASLNAGHLDHKFLVQVNIFVHLHRRDIEIVEMMKRKFTEDLVVLYMLHEF